MRSGEMGATTYWKVFAERFVFGGFERRKFKLEKQKHCRGRCYGGVYTHPVSVRCGGRTNFRTYTLRI